TQTVVGKVPAGPDPHEVIACADGKFAYISNYGGGAYNTITVVDLVNQKTLPVIDLGALIGPHGLAFVGGKLWFTAEGAKAVGRYDPTTSSVDWIMGTGQNRTHMVYVTADEKHVYATNVDSGTVSILENVLRPPTMPPTGVMPPGAKPHTEWIQTVISVAKGSEGFDVSPDGRELWTAAAGGGTV